MIPDPSPDSNPNPDFLTFFSEHNADSKVHGLHDYALEAKQTLKTIGIWLQVISIRPHCYHYHSNVDALQVMIVWPCILILPATIVIWAFTGDILRALGSRN